MWFILKFYMTQILVYTTSRFEFIGRLIKVTYFGDVFGISKNPHSYFDQKIAA
jgi:hypothetical protein